MPTIEDSRNTAKIEQEPQSNSIEDAEFQEYPTSHAKLADFKHFVKTLGTKKKILPPLEIQMQLARDDVERAEKEHDAKESDSSSSNESPKEISYRKAEDDDINTKLMCEIDDEVYDKDFSGKDQLKKKLDTNVSKVAPLVAALNEEKYQGHD